MIRWLLKLLSIRADANAIPKGRVAQRVVRKAAIRSVRRLFR